ncbi:hypothetical protein D3C78_1574960 [compost metagenome]
MGPTWPTITNVASTSSKAMYGDTSWRTGMVSMIRSKLERAAAIALASVDTSRLSAPSSRASASLSGVRLSTVTKAPSPAASFTAMWPRPPRPITATRLPGPTFQVRRGE